MRSMTTTDLAARAAYELAKARHRIGGRGPRDGRIVVFSMAKTGSSAVATGLRSAGHRPVHHVHDLDPELLRTEEAEYRWAGRPWRTWDAQRLVARPPSARAPWRVVSLVRDPIAQTISAFFQPGVRRGYLHDGVDVGDLLERFGDRFDRLPLRWFEHHIEPTFGIDVFASPFDPSRGYQILDTSHVRLLLLRCEGIDVAPVALAELLGASLPVPVPRVNVGAEKDHAALYARFRAALRPSDAQLDRAYGSRVVRHFYSADEIDRFRTLWSSAR
jgi:hypothetical protein